MCNDRARSQAGQLQNQLIQEQNANQWLRGQLDRAHKELQVSHRDYMSRDRLGILTTAGVFCFPHRPS